MYIRNNYGVSFIEGSNVAWSEASRTAGGYQRLYSKLPAGWLHWSSVSLSLACNLQDYKRATIFVVCGKLSFIYFVLSLATADSHWAEPLWHSRSWLLKGIRKKTQYLVHYVYIHFLSAAYTVCTRPCCTWDLYSIHNTSCLILCLCGECNLWCCTVYSGLHLDQQSSLVLFALWVTPFLLHLSLPLRTLRITSWSWSRHCRSSSVSRNHFIHSMFALLCASSSSFLIQCAQVLL